MSSSIFFVIQKLQTVSAGTAVLPEYHFLAVPGKENEMILKFDGVTADQLADLKKFVDSDANRAVSWSMSNNVCGPHRLVEILKTNVGIERGETRWQVALNVKESIEVGETKGKTETVLVSRHIIVRVLYILGRFPLDMEGKFNQSLLKPEMDAPKRTIDEAVGCPHCHNTPLVTSGGGRCINCGFMDCD